MKTTNSFALVLAFALGTTAAGCSAADPAAMPGDDEEQPGGDDDGQPSGGGGGEQPRPLEVAGTYTVHSTFDLATHMPGTAGDVVNTVIQLTDTEHGYPTKWLVDQMIGVLGDGTLKSTLQLLETLGVEWLNDKLLSFAPDFVGSALQIGNDFGDLAKHFGLNETLTLTGSGTTYTAVHTITGVHFKLGNQEGDYAFANYGMENVVVNNVAVTMDATGQLTIAAHSLPIAYGRVLRLALDAAIIPLLDDNAHNLNELFAHLINCDTVGDFIHARFVIVPSSAVSAVCSLGLDAGAGFIYAKIEAIDGTALTFGLSGTARAQDTNNDRKIDKIQGGAWSGTMTYGATPAPLTPAAFFGERN
jgi:hypothetical protein